MDQPVAQQLAVRYLKLVLVDDVVEDSLQTSSSKYKGNQASSSVYHRVRYLLLDAAFVFVIPRKNTGVRRKLAYERLLIF